MVISVVSHNVDSYDGIFYTINYVREVVKKLFILTEYFYGNFFICGICYSSRSSWV